ncbi:MAG: ornithine carbamoyltransferase [Candidatus Edwardsbacteria bacterium]
MKKDLVSVSDLTKSEIEKMFVLSKKIKSKTKKGIAHRVLKEKTLAMIFEKPSLRTRVTFETGMTQLGGHAIYLAPADIQLGKRESVADVASNLSRWVDAVMARTFSHQTIVELAENATVPVINGLSDLEHPCQILADFFTIYEHRAKKMDWRNWKLAYIGDGNNVCHSLLLASGILGMNISVGCPKAYQPKQEIIEKTLEFAQKTKAKIEILEDPFVAVKEADFIYTDVWASMGQEAEREERKRVFADYQVNAKLVAKAKEDVLVLHCLPAHRGEEITDEVIDGPHSIVLPQAENRLHLQKAILVKLLFNK